MIASLESRIRNASRIGKSRHLSGLLVSALVVTTGCSEKPPSADLDRVLDVTVNTITSVEGRARQLGDSQAMDVLAQDLTTNMNRAAPPVHQGPIGVVLQQDGSLLGFQDMNVNRTLDGDDSRLFTVEVDGERGRLIATDVNNMVRDHSFGAGGLMAGYLLGSLLNRQSAAGVSPSSLSNKVAMARTDYGSARSRAGSGSHSSGK